MRRVVRLFPILLFVLAACGGAGDAETDPLVDRGAALYKEKACASCHSVDGSKLVGPTWKGLYGSEVELSDGSKVVADEVYLAESMLRPSAQTVKGYQEGLMETVVKPNSLTQEEVEALTAYIESLS